MMQPPVTLVILAWDEAESIGVVLSEVPPELASGNQRNGNVRQRASEAK